MKNCWIFIFVLFIASCANETNSTAQTQAPQQAQSPAPVAAKQTPPPSEPKVSTRPVNKREESTATGFSIIPTTTTVKAGSEACIPVKVKDFTDIMTMQYSMNWDADKLSFSKAQGFNLPYLSKQNFGTHLAKSGTLTFLWLNNALKGNTVTNDSAIYEVCFQVTGKAGQTASFSITDKPTVIEAMNANEQLVQLKAGVGTITIE
ncbi:MAG: cohesin domain-containing protein [Bacteroidota bacterium]